MGRKVQDLTGKIFTRLTVVERAENKGNNVMWQCVCTCGSLLIIEGNQLKRGSTKSCGCYRKDRMTTHNESRTRLYRIWSLMLDRCTNDNSDSYKWYGGRGIMVCEYWRTYECFAEWAKSNGYNEHLEIDRVDVDGNYDPGNCRWVSSSTQAYNKRQYENNTSGRTGVILTRGKWCARISVSGKRIYLGEFVTIEEAIVARKIAEIKYYGELKHE